MAQEIYGVKPGSDDYSHEIVLKARGKRYGLKLLRGTSSLHVIPPRRQAPPMTLEQASFHRGRGAETWTQNTASVYDTHNAWDGTPNKLHPTLLMQWTTGMRDAEMNMPGSGDVHVWKPLYAGTGSDTNRRYLSVSFTASATSNRERSWFILRKRGTPGTVTVEWCSDSAGSPGTVQKTATPTNTPSDIVSYYVEFKPSSVLAVTSGTTYHLKIYGASSDNANNCWEVLCDSAAAGKNSSDNSSWSATTYSPYYRITDADVGQRVYVFNFDGAWYAVTSPYNGTNSKLYIQGCRGKATATTSTTLSDSGAGQYGGTWTTNMWANLQVRIVRGTGLGQVRTISSNTSTQLTVSQAWFITPDTTSEYVIYGGAAWKEITGHGLTIVTGKPAYANGTVYFPQGDSTNIRIMQLNYANANDHGFDEENTNNNKAYFLVDAYDPSLGPILVRANITSATGTPTGKAVSVAKAPTSPLGTPVSFGTDVNFATSILAGDNTFRIRGLYNHQDQVYVAKDDCMYSISGNVPVKIKFGADSSPSGRNGIAGVTGMDGLFYIACNHDVVFLSGSNSYPTNLPFNLPSNRSGDVMDMCSKLGWLFAAVNAGDSGWSSVMRMNLQDRSWHEQIRGFAIGRKIRTVEWIALEDARPQLVFECEGELLFQEFPLYGVRPVQDTTLAYQHEGVVELSTMDLLNTNPKYFGFFAGTTKKLANSDTAAAYGREIAVDYQLNDNIGGSTWINAGAFGISPKDKVIINQGSQMKLRGRLRILSNQANNPPIMENMALNLFTREPTFNTFLMDLDAESDPDLSGGELYDALVSLMFLAEPVQTESVFEFLHNKRMLLTVQPNMNITSLDADEGLGAVLQLHMEYLPT